MKVVAHNTYAHQTFQIAICKKFCFKKNMYWCLISSQQLKCVIVSGQNEKNILLQGIVIVADGMVM